MICLSWEFQWGSFDLPLLRLDGFWFRFMLTYWLGLLASCRWHTLPEIWVMFLVYLMHQSLGIACLLWHLALVSLPLLLSSFIFFASGDFPFFQTCYVIIYFLLLLCCLTLPYDRWGRKEGVVSSVCPTWLEMQNIKYTNNSEWFSSLGYSSPLVRKHL